MKNKYKHSLLINELKFLLHSKMLWIIILLIDLFMVAGINSINLSNLMRLHNIKRTSLTISLGSAKYGAMAGTILFSVFAILILSKDKRKKSLVITEACLEYDVLTFVRIAAIIVYEFITVLIGMVLVIFVQWLAYGIPVDFSKYVYSYGIVLLPALIFAVFLGSGLYMSIESIDVSILVIVMLFFIDLTANSYLLKWIDLGDLVFSDFAGIKPVGKLMVHNRLFWTCISVSSLCFGFLTRRRYGFGMIKSFLVNKKRNIIGIILITAVFLGAFAYVIDPYTMNSNFVDTEPGTLASVKLKSVKPEINFDNEKERMHAHVLYEFDQNHSSFIQFAINEGLQIQSVNVNGEKAGYEKIAGTCKIKIPVPKKENIDIEINYDGTIKYDKNGGIAGYICKDSIYLLEVSNFIFRPMTENEKSIDITGYYSAPNKLTIVTPGTLTGVESKNEKKLWKFSYKSQSLNIGAFAAEYRKSQFRVHDSEIEFYYSPKHESYIKKNHIEKYINDMFAYYSDTIGPYYTKEHPLKIVETSIYKPGGHSSGNVISFGEYMVNRDNYNNISDSYMASLPFDLQIISHEMAHQWWGTGVEFDEKKAWSSEGFAQYLSYKYLVNEFGDGIVNAEFLGPWEQKSRTLNTNYYLKNSRNLDTLNKTLRYAKEMERTETLRYYFFPIQLIEAEKEHGEDKFLMKLSEVYKNNMNKSLNYDTFLKEMGLTKEVLSLE